MYQHLSWKGVPALLPAAVPDAYKNGIMSTKQLLCVVAMIGK
jgi:hypothetical protein